MDSDLPHILTMALLLFSLVLIVLIGYLLFMYEDTPSPRRAKFTWWPEGHVHNGKVQP